MSDSRTTPPASGRGLVSLPARLLSGAIWVYQRTLSPALVALNPACGCRFAPSCSHYAREALREHGLFAGIGLTLVRLAKCGPWHPGGEDPVPARTPPVCIRISSPS
ncbi:MAG TPA: membrane protein insertion efficiency factor YidD [Lacunisphaera sp.]|nr:membrane protein insertion efficiency factor YidD [Lacunisphaera sp.]